MHIPVYLPPNHPIIYIIHGCSGVASGTLWSIGDSIHRMWSNMSEKTDETNDITKKLRERVKELNTLYKISKVMTKKNIPFEQQLSKIAEIIPPGWQYSEICCSRITIGPTSVTSPRFREGRWSQKEKIFYQGEPIGCVEVHYLAKRPEADDGPFLLEERNLLIEIANRLSEFYNLKQSEWLMQEQKRYTDLFNNAVEPIMICHVSADALPERFLFLNDAFCNLLQYVREELERITPASLMPPEDKAMLYKSIKEATSKGYAAHPIKLTTKDGTVLTLDAQTHILDISGETYCITIFR
ncbi:PAS domain S-box protein [archaeon]|nr:MAG: PAS domain S-box protein [archaeon]